VPDRLGGWAGKVLWAVAKGETEGMGVLEAFCKCNCNEVRW
jgi:hypothetical protein